MKYNNRLYLLGEFYFILRFYDFSWMDFHPTGMPSNSHHTQKWIFLNMKFEIKKNQFGLNMFKKKFKGLFEF